MSVQAPIQIINNGLVFCFDTNNAKSYKGQPTTNYVPYPLAAYNGNTLAIGDYNYANNGVTYTLDTSVLTPIGDYSGVLRYYTGNTDYKYFSIKGSNLPSGTYTFSYYARLAAGSSNIGNTQLWRDGNTDRSVTGDWNPTFTTDWKRYTTTGPIDTAGATGNALNYFPVHSGSITGGYTLYYWGFQLEKLSYASQFVNGSRSNTNSLLDFTNNTTLNLANATYSNANISWPGNNYITTNTNCNLTGDQTLTAWIKPKKTTAGPHNTVICTDPSYQYGIKLMNYKNNSRYGLWLGFGSSNYEALYGVDINNNTNKMLTGTWKQSTGVVRLYINGAATTSFSTGVTSAISLNTGNIYVGTGYELDWGNGNMYEGELYSASIYNRTLTDAEILQLYNATRSRFGL